MTWDSARRLNRARLLAAVLLLGAVAASSLRAAEPPPRVLRQTWYELRAETGKLGHMHFLAVEKEEQGRKLIHTTIREQFSYLRSGDPYSETMEQHTLETAAGQIVEIGYRVNLSKKQHLHVRGRPQGDTLTFQVVGDDGQPMPFHQTIPWDAATLGLYAQDCYFQNQKLTAGERLEVKTFSVSANRVVPTFLTLQPDGRVEQSFPKDLYLDKAHLTLNADQLVARIEQKTSLFGPVRYELTSREKAEAAFQPMVKDVEAPIAVNKPIGFDQGPPKSLVLRVSMEGEDDPGALFLRDGRQQLLKSDRQTAELKLATRSEPASPAAPPPAPEYLGSNFFIRSDDEGVRKLAQEILGEEKDPRRQLRLLARWFRRSFHGSYEVAFATADEVAKTKEGDCSEMGVLAAALCRARGIPSRVVFGLVYDPGNPGFGGHLWTEVFVNNAWQPFDPTGVLEVVGPAYLKIADYSLKDILNPDELLAVRRAFAGTMKVEVVEVMQGD